ncbi:DUF1918 domain-containing protein [Streptomyces sp. HPF1205]|uniref:DUF1918 domain-containing protein n=1 Tax=Streptomyces sp. HPF1205 TaxID=2873262 RepID=UPI001CECF4BA|nr:DUF1918 domain-containing protein [Streptomyces sp. HPF1205]
MRAHVGDWIVVESRHLDGPRRRGRIMRLEHPDGTPPYVVRWIENDRETVFFPGPETHLETGHGRDARGHASA